MIFDIRIYDTVKNKKINVKTNKTIKIYSCGLTPSGEMHIGHLRNFLITDYLIHNMKKNGSVLYVRNITDYDLKVEEKLKGESLNEYLYESIKKMKKVCIKMRFDTPDFEPRVTKNIRSIIKFIDLIKNKYRDQNGILFKITNANNLTGNKIGKDFYLWKLKENGIRWTSKYGDGIPGWHTECACFVNEYFDELDLHIGGSDLKHPHHQNEEHQMYDVHGKKFVKNWIHIGMIKMEGKKMSKSLGNVLNANRIIDLYGPSTVKILMYKTHYKKDIDLCAADFTRSHMDYLQLKNIEKTISGSKYSEMLNMYILRHLDNTPFLIKMLLNLKNRMSKNRIVEHHFKQLFEALRL